MRDWIIPLFAISVVAGSNPTYEPSEAQMRMAFEGSLAAQVRNALDFTLETAGEEAVTKIRAGGMDRYSLNAFQKLNCEAEEGRVAHVCRFSLDVGLVNGPLQTTISGRFIKSPGGFVFANSI